VPPNRKYGTATASSTAATLTSSALISASLAHCSAVNEHGMEPVRRSGAPRTPGGSSYVSAVSHFVSMIGHEVGGAAMMPLGLEMRESFLSER